MRISALAAILAVALASVPAAAQNAAPAAPAATPADEDFTPSHLKAASRVIAAVKGDINFDEILPGVAAQTRNIFTRTNPALTREIEDTTTEVAIEMVPRRVQLSKTLELIWARRFSEEELNALAVFFEGPLGKKYIETFPVVGMLSVGASNEWEQGIAADMVAETRKRLREQGHAL
ncbi:DUF2059 domain-containing protein [Acuticoccus sp. MNP-M23]|uniref:DUF2059 domain-containing protein n=1 Tax=Acuticoccus sp. MNP-M23 TaxID=3072793 RepID=UPI002815576C|nr:DUF2059 domain-containing protein [Acuticoccus sp. MNP-M23]WMS41220.1 DUF2059 domain-containing protein [Acuticoccus sp. MNP-M23]